MVVTGYKVYFDGEKFVADDTRSLVQSLSDAPVWWMDKACRAASAAAEYNEHLKLIESDMTDDKDVVVRKCKECGEYFMIIKPDYDWFKNKGLASPRRCNACRIKRRKEAKAKSTELAEATI